MKTPCELDPDKWVSDSRADREIAKRRCFDCPEAAFIACAALATRTNPVLGVWAGTDYNRGDDLMPETSDCQHCGFEYHRRAKESIAVFEQRKYCGKSCANKAHRDAAKARAAA